jgi:hypothetical protein
MSDTQSTGPTPSGSVPASYPALTAPLPQLYVNSIGGIALTATDLAMTLMWNGAALANVTMTFPFAKGLAEDLARAVSEYERLSNQNVQAVGVIITTMQQGSQNPTGSA